MDKINIVICAGKYLDSHKTITAIDLQRFMISRPEIGKAIDINEIAETLDDLQFAGFLNVINSGLYKKD